MIAAMPPAILKRMEHDIGAFLRSRRDRIQPAANGLRADGRRKVPGLRREELAQLASVSVDYYVRLEQGRSPNVSDAILDAIAAALQLSDIEREHLGTLARPGERDEPSLPTSQTLRPGLQRLLDQMDAVPAFVLGRRTDVLGWNALGDAVMGFSALGERERNSAWFTFMDARATELYADWEAIAAETVAYLCLDAGRHPGDRRLAALVGELAIASASFRRLWARHDVLEKTRGQKLLHHPILGDLAFGYEVLTMPDDPDQLLCTLTVEPGSATAERLQILARPYGAVDSQG